VNAGALAGTSAGEHGQVASGRTDPAPFDPELARHGFAIRRPATTPPVWPFAGLATGRPLTFP
jgi:hypothetical protein